MKRPAVILIALLMPCTAFAHANHTTGDFGLFHFLTEPSHIALAVVAGLVLMTLVRSLRRD